MKLIDVGLLTIAADRQRRLFNEDSMQELRDSIEKFGLMHPLVVRPDGARLHLVAGERRLRAVKDLWELGSRPYFNGEELPIGQIPCATLGELSPIEAEEAELDENLRRDNLTWQEHAAAVARLQRLRNSQAAAAGVPPPTVAQLADEAFIPKRDGVDAGSTSYGQQRIRKELVVAKYLDVPAVKAAKSVDEAFKVVKRQEELARSEELGRVVGQIFSRADHLLLNGDCLELLPGLDPGFDVLLTDPPYGMGADSFGTSDGRAMTGEEVHMYRDDDAVISDLVLPALERASALCKPVAHAYVFCDIEKFFQLREFFRSLGWKPFRTPLIWRKPDGRVPLPQHGPRRTYEMLLYAFRGDKPVRKMADDVLEVRPDVNLNLAAQKPVELFSQLLQRSCLPGDRALDPFAGTGTIIAAAHPLKVRATAIELNPQSYGIAAERLGKL